MLWCRLATKINPPVHILIDNVIPWVCSVNCHLELSLSFSYYYTARNIICRIPNIYATFPGSQHYNNQPAILPLFRTQNWPNWFLSLFDSACQLNYNLVVDASSLPTTNRITCTQFTVCPNTKQWPPSGRVSAPFKWWAAQVRIRLWGDPQALYIHSLRTVSRVYS